MGGGKREFKDWTKYKLEEKPCFVVWRALNLYFKAYKEAKTMYYTVTKHTGYLRTLEKFRKHSRAARVF